MWAGSARMPTSVLTGWLIFIYHRRTFTGWTVSIMACERTDTDMEMHKGRHAVGEGRRPALPLNSCLSVFIGG